MMRAALALARRSLGRTWPNPAVGCVVVRDGRVDAGGRTQAGGRPHAEADAIAQAIARVWTDDTLCIQLAKRGRKHALEFMPKRLVEEHVAAFELARRRYRPWKHWYRARFLKPRSELPRHALTPHEAAAAQKLLRKLQVPSSVT